MINFHQNSALLDFALASINKLAALSLAVAIPIGPFCVRLL